MDVVLGYCIESSELAGVSSLQSCPNTHPEWEPAEPPLVAVLAVSCVAATQVCCSSPGKTHCRIVSIGLISSEFWQTECLLKKPRQMERP
jgi:hypothetical protein